MKPLHLSARNFRTWEAVDLDIPDGLFSLIGENGAGKSSLFMLIDVCLFGPESRSLADYHSQDALDDMEIELSFEHDGETYRVRRGYSPRGVGKSTCDFEHIADDGTADPVTMESIAATDSLVEETIGLSRETFRASNYLVQGARCWADPSWPAREKKALLFSALGLDRTWTPALEACRADKRALEDQGRELAGRMALLEQQVAEKMAVELRIKAAWEHSDQAKAALAEAERALADLTGSIAEAERGASRRREAVARHESAVAVLSLLDAQEQEAQKAATELANVHTEIAALKPKVDALPALEVRMAEARQLESRKQEHARRASGIEERARQAAQHRGEAEMLKERAEHMENEEDATCDRCGQALHANARKQAVDSIAAQIDELQAKAQTIDDAVEEERAALGAETVENVAAPPLAQIEQHLTAARDAERRLSMCGGRLVSLTQTAAKLSDEGFSVSLMDARSAAQKAEQDVAALPPQEVDADRLKREAVVLQADQRNQQVQLNSAREALARADEALERIHQAEQEIEEGRQARLAADAELSLLDDVERAVGQNGVPLFIVEAIAIPAIEERANEILRALACDYRIELRTQREKKSGDGLIETLDVLVIDGEGERPFETYSGGEQSRVVPALQLAVAELLAKRRGAESKVLLVDELPYLDASGTASLVELLRELAAGDVFSMIGVVSHVPDLRDAFDASIQVVKSGGRSEVLA